MDLGNASRPSNPDETAAFILAVSVLVGVTSALSLIGGILIPATWLIGVCSSERSANPPPKSTPARVILCFLGAADALVAFSHLSGIVVGYEKYNMNNVTDEISNSGIHVFCVFQGSLAVYSTVASFLWTIILSLFVFATVLLPCPRRFGGCWAMIAYSVVGWGIPACVFAALFAMKDYGYERTAILSWCFSKSQGSPEPQRDIINLLSYDLWAAITFVILGTLILVVCFDAIRKKRKRSKMIMDTPPLRRGINQAVDESHESTPLLHDRYESHTPAKALYESHEDTQLSNERQESHTRVKTSDFKLLFVAVILIVLRVWDLPFVILRYHSSAAKPFNHTYWATLLIVLEEVGDSAQGIANAILFLFFVKDYRVWIWNGLKNCCCHQYKASDPT